MQPLKIAVVGLDTSHSVELPRLMNSPECKPEIKVEGMKVVAVNRFETPFQNKEGLDKRQAQLEEWGIKVTEDFDEAVADCDAIMMEINDPAYHKEYFSRICKLGKPVFLDKPLAGNLEDGRAIIEMARSNNVRVWSGSSLPFAPELLAAQSRLQGEALFAHSFGALGTAPAGNSLIWYGVHSFEMMQKLIGHPGAEEVTSTDNGVSVVSVVNYSDGRRGVVESIRGAWKYGGRVQSARSVETFVINSVLYYNLLLNIRPFFRGSQAPVTLEKSFEGLAIMVAANESIETGKSAKVAKLD